jgi:ribosomal protein L44E
VLKEAEVGRQINKDTGKLALHYRCAQCSGVFTSKNIAVDHLDPVVDPKQGFVSWDVFIERLYVEMDKLQVLCKECHTKKTLLERKERKK